MLNIAICDDDIQTTGNGYAVAENSKAKFYGC